MLDYDELSLTELDDPRTREVVRLLTERVYGQQKVAATLEAAGLVPGKYTLDPAELAWLAAVPDAARQRRLGLLLQRVADAEPAFLPELHRRMAPLVATPFAAGAWYHYADPLRCRFVGPGARRAVVDRNGLRQALQALASDDFRVLLVTGEPRSGKSHTWVLVDHLRSAGSLLGSHRFARVTTHHWSGDVHGQDLARSLIAKLALDVVVQPANEADETMVRKLLDGMVGLYPADGVTRWIVLDGLDRANVQGAAHDFARTLVDLVNAGELPDTRLIVTGLDPLGLDAGYGLQYERIPAIDEALVRSFVLDVAAHLARDVDAAEVDALVAEVLAAGGDGDERDLAEVERALFRVLSSRWGAASAAGVGAEAGHGG
jgi:hypothetical protein